MGGGLTGKCGQGVELNARTHTTASLIRTPCQCLRICWTKDVQPGEEECIGVGGDNRRWDTWKAFRCLLQQLCVKGNEVEGRCIGGCNNGRRRRRWWRWHHLWKGWSLCLLFVQRRQMGVDMLYKATHVGTNVTAVETLSTRVRNHTVDRFRLLLLLLLF